MKQCPLCRRTYTDETLAFCLEDGSPLVAQIDSEVTQQYIPAATERFETPRTFAPPSQETFQINLPLNQSPPRRSKFWIVPAIVGLLFLIVGGSVAVFLLTKDKTDKKSLDTTVRTIAANAADNANKPTPSPTATKPASFKLVNTWESDVNEQGVKTHIIYTFNADGTSKAFFKTSRGQTGKDTGTWQFSDNTLYERFSNGVSGKSSLRWIDDDTFEITIIDNGTPAYSGLKRTYHRKS
ncbi:MAG: hypothetical protein ACR2HG_00580 [Pyrinomonadaceae bacterium]